MGSMQPTIAVIGLPRILAGGLQHHPKLLNISGPHTFDRAIVMAALDIFCGWAGSVPETLLRDAGVSLTVG
jgi:hypothetical protein